jgi:UDP-glucose 4-epimerase
MPTALVTGGAGFIGSHLVRGLLERGDQVCVLDDLSTGRQENLARLPIALVVGDVRSPAEVRRAADGVDEVYHLAAMVSVPESMADPLACYQANVLGSVNVLAAARDAGARGVVLASSCAVYGEANGAVSEASPTQPLSPYAATKLAMEDAGRMFTAAFGLPVVSLRYFNVYGPRQSPDSPYAAVIPAFLRRLLDGQAPMIHGDGRQTRDFVYVGDVVRASLLAMRCDGAAGSVLNIGGGRSVSILELVTELGLLLPGTPAPAYAPARPGDIRFSAAKLDLASSVLGYTPRTTLAQGLQATLAELRISSMTTRR